MTFKRLISIDEAASYMGIKKNTLYSWVWRRKLPFVKCGRRTMFDIKDIDEWIDGRKVKAEVL